MTYKVILHNGTKAFQKVPEMEEPIKRQFTSNYECAKYINEYEAHLADCSNNIIPIAPEYQGHWKVGQSVPDSEFEIAEKGRRDIDGNFWDNPQRFAIPKPLEQEKEEGMWISVKDRLPDAGKPVLIYQNGVCLFFVKYCPVGHNGNSEAYFIDLNDKGAIGINEGVTHWQPLPKPPIIKKQTPTP